MTAIVRIGITSRIMNKATQGTLALAAASSGTAGSAGSSIIRY